MNELFEKSNNSYCLYHLGEFYYFRQDYEMAYKCYLKSYKKGYVYAKSRIAGSLMKMGDFSKAKKILEEVVEEHYNYYAALNLSKIILEHYYHDPDTRVSAIKQLDALLASSDSTYTIGEAYYLYGKYISKNTDSIAIYYQEAYKRHFVNGEIYLSLIKNEQSDNEEKIIDYLYDAVRYDCHLKDSSIVEDRVLHLLFSPIYEAKTVYGTKLRILNFIVDPLDFNDEASILDNIFSKDSTARIRYNKTLIFLNKEKFIDINDVDSIEFKLYSKLEKYYWYDLKKAVYYYTKAHPLANNKDYNFVDRGSYVYKLAQMKDTSNLINCCETIYKYAHKRDAELVMKFMFDYIQKDSILIDEHFLYRANYDTVRYEYDPRNSYGKYFKMASDELCIKNLLLLN